LPSGSLRKARRLLVISSVLTCNFNLTP
jgi:hypothetical protein